MKWTDEQMMAELLSTTSPLNKARQQFSSWSAKIENAHAQRGGLNPVKMRHMEFEAVIEIMKALGIDDERTIPLGGEVSPDQDS